MVKREKRTSGHTPKNCERKEAKITETEKDMVDGFSRLKKIRDEEERHLKKVKEDEVRMGTEEDNRSAAGKEEAPRRRVMTDI